MSSSMILAYVSGARLTDPQQIPAEKLTHLCYAFANIVDGEVVLITEAGNKHQPRNEQHFVWLRELKQRNPRLQNLISIGGWTADGFSDAALSEQSRARFAQSAVEFVRTRGLDGVDLDWEYPSNDMAGIKARPEDRQNFTLMLRELRRQLDAATQADGRQDAPYLLMIAAGVAQYYLDGVEMAEVAAELDYVNMMTYDLYNGWSVNAGHHAPLFASREDPKGWSAAEGIELFVRAGVPASKMLLGCAFYGRGLAGVSGGHTGAGTPGSNSVHEYSEIRRDLLTNPRYQRHWDVDAKAPWLYDGDHFVSYDDAQSLLHKCDYARARGLAGVFFWELLCDESGELLDALVAGVQPRT